MTISDIFGGELRVEESYHGEGKYAWHVYEGSRRLEEKEKIQALAAGSNLLRDVEGYVNDLRSLVNAARRQQNRKPDLFWEDYIDLNTCDEAIDLIERRLREAKGESDG